MLLQYIPWKREWISQPHGNKWLNGRIQPSVSQTFPIHFPPSLCCCKPFHKKDLRAFCSNFSQQCAGFSRCPHATPKPVCANAALPWKRSKQHFKRRTHSKKSLRWIFYSVQVFPPYTHTTPKPVCANAALPWKMSKQHFKRRTHSRQKFSRHCQTFLLHAFHNRSEAHCPINCAVSFLFLYANAATGVRMYLCASPSSRSDAPATGVLNNPSLPNGSEIL